MYNWTATYYLISAVVISVLVAINPWTHWINWGN